MNKTKTLNEIVLTILSENKGRWVKGYEIRHYLYFNSIGGLKVSGIELRNIIKHLRFGGHPIIAGPKGYKFADNEEELELYVISRRAELESELSILRHMVGKW